MVCEIWWLCKSLKEVAVEDQEPEPPDNTPYIRLVSASEISTIPNTHHLEALCRPPPCRGMPCGPPLVIPRNRDAEYRHAVCRLILGTALEQG